MLCYHTLRLVIELRLVRSSLIRGHLLSHTVSADHSLSSIKSFIFSKLLDSSKRRMMAHAYPIEAPGPISPIMATTRCENCKCLELDDLAIGSKECRDTFHRQSFLGIENTSPGRPFLPLNYRFEDEFPGFPRLLESSRQGCDFCGFLRDHLSGPQPEAGRTTLVSLEMHYIWDRLTWLSSGFVGFRVHMAPVDASSLEYKWGKFLTFQVLSEPGTSRTLQL